MTAPGSDLIFTISVEGDLGLSDIEKFEGTLNSLMTAGCKKVILDMEKVGFVPSRAIGAILRLSQVLAEAGGKLVLASTPESVAKAMGAIGVPELLVMLESVAAAKASLGKN